MRSVEQVQHSRISDQHSNIDDGISKQQKSLYCDTFKKINFPKHNFGQKLFSERFVKKQSKIKPDTAKSSAVRNMKRRKHVAPYVPARCVIVAPTAAAAVAAFVVRRNSVQLVD